MSDHTTLTDTERATLAAWWESDWPSDGADVLDTLAATVESIVAARVAQARADVIGLLRSEAAAHEALSQTWHDDMDIAALGFTTAADYLDGLTQGADHG